MKKILFNDKFGLTEAVLSGRKTQTRRIIPKSLLNACDLTENPIVFRDANDDWWDLRKSKYAYQVGEIVAVAQAYKDAGVIHIPCEDDEFGCYDFPAEQTHGWDNKILVRANLMPHQIRITNVRVEKLQEISDEDCLKEGVVKIVHRISTEAEQYTTRYYPCQYLKDCADDVGWGLTYATPQQAYAHLIDAISGKETWASNPHVFVYDFELIK